MRTHALIAIALSTAACSSSDSDPDSDADSQPTREDYDDAAQAIASATSTGGGGGDLASLSDSVSLALGVMPLGFVLDASGEIRGSRLGVEYRYSIACEDEDGEALPVCSALSDSAAVDLSWSGQLDTPNVDASVMRDGSWSLGGLQSGTAVFDGESGFSFDSELRSVFRPGAVSSFSFDAEASYDGVAVSTATREVLAGAAVFEMSARKVVSGTANDIDKAFSVRAELDFETTGTAGLVLDGDQQYTLDLATGAVVRVN